MSALSRVILLLSAAALAACTLLAAGGAGARPSAPQGPWTEVVVTLPAPPLATAIHLDRTLAAAATRHRRLNLRAPASVSYVRRLASAQRSLQQHVEAAIPGAQVRWRYRVVANGLAVVVPRSQLDRLAALPGVARVYPSYRYH